MQNVFFFFVGGGGGGGAQIRFIMGDVQAEYIFGVFCRSELSVSALKNVGRITWLYVVVTETKK